MRRRTTAAAVLVAVGLLLEPGCGGLSPQARTRFDEALAANEKEEWERSAGLWIELLAEEPELAPARLHYGETLLELGKHHEAIEEIERALDSGDLDERDTARAHCLRGLAWIGVGREILDDSSFRRRAGTPEETRRARDAFLAASVALGTALEVAPDSYEALLWRGYALYRQENSTKAVDLLDSCEKIRSDDWKARFFRALALEALHGPNLQSFRLALDASATASGRDERVLVRYLVDGYPLMPADFAARVPDIVRKFRRKSGTADSTVEAFIAQVEEREARERRNRAARATAEAARGLAAGGDVAAAITLIREYETKEAPDEDLSALAGELADRWLRLLDLRAQSALQATDEKLLREVIDEYSRLGQAAKRLEVKIAAQQKLNELRLALAHFATSSELKKIEDLLESGNPEAALAALDTLNPAELAPADKDLWHWLSGLARFRLEDWTGAVTAIQSIRDRSRKDLDLIQGLAYARLGRKREAVRLLAAYPPRPDDDGVNRMLAEYFIERGEDARGATYLTALREPTPQDTELLASTLKRLGLAKYRLGDWGGAIEDLAKARLILDETLRRTDPDLDLLLGNAHFRRDDLAGAKRIYEALVNSDLSSEERVRCRDVYIDLCRIHLAEKREDLAYLDLREYLRLADSIPEELSEHWGRLAAAFADYMPLDRVLFWNYTSTLQDYNYTLSVREKKDGRYLIERRESGRTLDEVWKRDGHFVVQNTGRDGSVEFRIPVNVDAIERTLPFVEYRSGQDGRLRFTTEVVATNRTVTLSDGKKYTGCLQVRVTRTIPLDNGRSQRTRFVVHLAPEIGEVKREEYRDDVKVAETELSGVVFRAADGG